MPTTVTGVDFAGHNVASWDVLIGTLQAKEQWWADFVRGTQIGSSATAANGWTDEHGNWCPHRPVYGSTSDQDGIPDPPFRVAYLHFRHSRCQNLHTWWDQHFDEDDARQMEFAPGPDGHHKPSVWRCYRAFQHLELWCAEEFEELHRKLLHLIADKDPLAFRYIMVDATEIATWAVATHDCREGEFCRGNLHGKALGKFARAAKIHKVTAQDAADIRQQLIADNRSPVG
ncbi:MAG: hypothetical protein JWQ18_28 [Conexibacter sp.]|nr:hypothetical protein [Conexibacter sp.]